MIATPATEPAAPLTLTLFGSLEVRVGDAPLPPLRSRKGYRLLALLALRGGSEVERAWVAGMLWPESPEPQALANLRNTLKDLRRALGPQADRLSSPTVRTLAFDLAGATVDVRAFNQALAQGEPAALEQAVALYRGPLLEEWVEEWVFQERQQREEQYLAALETLAEQAQGRGEGEAAERYLRRVVAREPTRESAQRALLALLGARGDYAAVVEVYRELRERLHREFNAAPAPETTALFQQLRTEARQRAHPGLSARSTTREVRSTPSSAPVAAAPAMTDLLHEGTLTCVMTDIEGSTRLWEQHPDLMGTCVARHDALLTATIETHTGHIIRERGEGDSFFAVFARASDAVAAACEIQRAIAAEPWPAAIRIRTRIALHTGEAELRDGNFYGIAVNRCARLRAIAHGGQVLLSTATRELVRDALPPRMELRDLGRHRLRDLQRPEQVFQLLHPELPVDFPPLVSLDVFPNNLPLQPTRFIGREIEMTEVKRLLKGTQLLTLTGAGGTGKTRLALQTAADLLPNYVDGVWLVELAPLADANWVPHTVASVLQLSEEPGKSLTQTLVEGLRAKRLLIMLDNCEHLLSACAGLADVLLRSCPEVQILATSREGLNISGETTYRLLPLPAPDPRSLPARLEQLSQYDAVRLFIDRASAAVPSFAVTSQNAPAIAQICHRLDGMPLAIELAAARIRVLPLEVIQERLDDRFRLLTGGSRTALPRQQTLRAAIDWSYDLLSEQERAVLRRLSVFAGGWTLEAAEAVCASDDVNGSDIIDLMTSLAEKSLAGLDEPTSAAHYRMLETVREYVRDRLVEAGEEAVVRGRHLEFFLRLAEEAEPHLNAPEAARWLARLKAEHDNLRTALEWSRSTETKVELGLRLTLALWDFWDSHALGREGLEYVKGLLDKSSAVPPALRAAALYQAGVFTRFRGNYSSARRLLESALELYRSLGDKEGIARMCDNLGRLALDEGRLELARPLLEESLGVYRELHDKGELQDKKGIAWALLFLGHVIFRQGNILSARPLYDESLILFDDAGYRIGVARALLALGKCDLFAGKHASARSRFEECLAIVEQFANRPATVVVLEGMAQLAWAQGDAVRMARLFGAVERVREEARWPVPFGSQADYEAIPTARATLGEEAFTVAWTEGRAMTLDEAVAYASGRSHGAQGNNE